MNFIKILKIADVFTLCNALSGLVAIVASLHEAFGIAAGFLILAVVFDFLDGKIAKATKQVNDFGKQLDSLADVISFGIAVCVFVYMQVKQVEFVFIYGIFIAAAVIRLARFNIASSKKYFEGVPVTVNGLLFPVIFFLGGNVYAYYSCLIVMAVLMVSGFRVNKI